MATTFEYVEYVLEQLDYFENVRAKKMFGEYMIYVNEKPILLICDNTVFVKMAECIREYMKNAEVGIPYEGSKPHYILDIDDKELCRVVIEQLQNVTPLPKKRKK